MWVQSSSRNNFLFKGQRTTACEIGVKTSLYVTHLDIALHRITIFVCKSSEPL